MENISFGDLWDAMIEAIRSDVGYFLAFIALLAGIWIANDILMPQSIFAGSVGGAIVNLVGQSLLIRRYFERKGVATSASLADGRYISIFGVSILTGLGIMAGMILLVIPGIILATRWFLSVPVLFAEQAAVTESMSSSWHITAPHAFMIFGLVIVISLPLLVAAIFLFALTDPDNMLSPLQSLTINVGIATTTVAGWLGAASSYYVIKGGAEQASEIFA